MSQDIFRFVLISPPGTPARSFLLPSASSSLV